LDKYNWNDEVEMGEMGGTCNTDGVKRKAHRFLMGKLEGKRLLGRPIAGGCIILGWIF
jgi:hypothetical protein